MIAAIYARKSTDEVDADAEAKSVQRQTEGALAFAAGRGWTTLPEHIYADDGVSGAETHKLVNRQRLLDTIQAGAPFQALVMRDTSRFSRRDGDEAFAELKAIDRAGVQVWFYQDGQPFKHGTFGDNVVGYVKAEAAADYRRQIAAWTRAAMEQKARKGYVTGGRCFGYDNVRVDGHVERRINEAEAATVRRIFEMAADGAGVKRIAHTLNAERVPLPARAAGTAGWVGAEQRALRAPPGTLQGCHHVGAYETARRLRRTAVSEAARRRVADGAGARRAHRLGRAVGAGTPAPEGRRRDLPARNGRAVVGPATHGAGVALPPDRAEPVRGVRQRDDGAQQQPRPEAVALLRLHGLP